MLSAAGPWGQAFETPTFHGDFELMQQRIVGQKHLKLVVTQGQEGDLLDAICFNIDLTVWSGQYNRARLVYRLNVNEFRGRQSLQLIVEAIEPL